MGTRTYGELWLAQNKWHIQAEPQVVLMAKRIFGKIPIGQHGVITLPHTPETCHAIDWFLKRYPLKSRDLKPLYAAADSHVERITRLAEMIDGNYQPRQFRLAVPPRKYQALAADIFLQARGLLLADDVGLGKTCTAICAMTEPQALPALVVCPAHLTRQWQAELQHFLPGIVSHVLKKTTPYKLPMLYGRGPDVIISSYNKMDGWAMVLGELVKLVIFDEGQELRRTDSKKYYACRHVALMAEYRLALTATPIYNYGAEFFNIAEVIRPGVLGERDEFLREWCVGDRLSDPAAFGAYLREQGVMIRRTRKDVGRELPSLSRITQMIDTDRKALDDVHDKAHELARTLLADEGQGIDKMQAAGELDMIVRQATGIAKAPHVAAFVQQLLENGEPVVLAGWHHAVYDIWLSRLEKFSPAMYTGRESPAKKQTELKRFLDGQTDLIIVSLRSGAGIDGLQHRCRTAVIGELDWSPAVHHQFIGRIDRDGQEQPVSAYFLIADEGCDPMMAMVNGIKRQQSDGILGEQHDPLQEANTSQGIRQIAASYLGRRES